MNCSVASAHPFDYPCRALVLGCFEQGDPPPFPLPTDNPLAGLITSLYETREFSGKLNKTRLVHTFGAIAADRVLLVGLGKKSELTGERLRQAAGSAVQTLRHTVSGRFASLLHLADRDTPAGLAATAEGFILGNYTFDRFKSKRDECLTIDEVVFLFPDDPYPSWSEKVLAETAAICAAVFVARDLVSLPGNIATPTYLANQARELAARHSLTCTVLNREEMEREQMEALLGVARGSHEPPAFIILEYRGASERKKPVVFVGKGVTFDSGGISLKPRDGMEKMKNDMAGAAAVLGALQAAAALKLPVNLVGLVPAAENLPGGGAYKPGDILRSMSGQTIEIVNTDAEGRLLLCDALHYAGRFQPAAIIDVATLTGACVVALGTVATGLMTTAPDLARGLRKAGEATGERVWELPLWDDYDDLLKSDIADLKNAGGPNAGAISAGCFLKKFIGTTPWVHLDIAGTAWEERGRPYQPKGATGVGVRLLVEFLRQHT